MNRMHLLGLLFVLLLSACASQTAPSHPDFSGRWVIDRTNSKLEFPNLASLDNAVLVIDHHEPNFKLQRSFTIAGSDSKISYELTTDGKETGPQDGGLGTYMRLTWEGDQLVFSARIVDRGGESTDTAHYHLVQGGSALQAEETYRGTTNNWDNFWVFNKQ
ncbi:MAG: hypothetical protein ABSE63_17865 [Thermoguttaceae bacterium]